MFKEFMSGKKKIKASFQSNNSEVWIVLMQIWIQCFKERTFVFYVACQNSWQITEQNNQQENQLFVNLVQLKLFPIDSFGLLLSFVFQRNSFDTLEQFRLSGSSLHTEYKRIEISVNNFFVFVDWQFLHTYYNVWYQKIKSVVLKYGTTIYKIIFKFCCSYVKGCKKPFSMNIMNFIGLCYLSIVLLNNCLFWFPFKKLWNDKQSKTNSILFNEHGSYYPQRWSFRKLSSEYTFLL